MYRTNREREQGKYDSNMAVDYKSFDFQIYEYLIRLDQLLAQAKGLPEAEGWRKRIEEERERIRTRRFRVAVVGEFRKGKTSFINALLGREILPVDALPTTATINRITFGAVPRASLHYRDGQVQEVDIAELASYVTKLTQESAGYAARIAEAVVEYPSVFCQNYVDLIDEEQMNAVTVAQLEKIDLAIVAVSATTPFSDTESSFVARLVESPEICQIILVITKIDQIREKERQKLLDYMTGRVCVKVEEKLAAMKRTTRSWPNSGGSSAICRSLESALWTPWRPGSTTMRPSWPAAAFRSSMSACRS